MSKVLIWLGAGQVEAPKISFDRFDAVVLIEARLEQVEELRKQFSHDDKVKIVHAVVSDKAQKAEFCRYSLDEYSALTSISGLKELYPGLRLDERDQVKTQLVSEVLNESEVNANSITLILDLLDVNHLVLDSLIQSEYWQRVSDIYLPIPDFALYEDAARASDILPKLTSHGFELSETDSADPDIPIAKLHRNPLWAELESLKKQHQLQSVQHQKVVDEYESKLLAQEEEAKSVKIEAAKSSEKQSIELEQLNTVIEQKNKELQTSHQKQIELRNVLESDKLAFDAQVKQLQSDQEKLIQAHQETTRLNQKQQQDLLNQLESLKTEKQQVIDSQETLKKFNEQQQQELLNQLEALKTELTSKTDDAEQLRASLELQETEFVKQIEILKSEKQQVIDSQEVLKKSNEQQQQELLNQLEALKAKLASKTSEAEQLSASIDLQKSEFMKQIEVLKSEKQQVIDSQEVLKKSNEQQRQDLVHQVETLAENVSQKSTEAEQLRTSLETEKSELVQQLDLVQAEKQQIEKELEEFKVKISTLDEKNKQEKEDNLQAKQSLQNQKNALEAELESLKVELEERTKQRDEQAHWHQKNKKWAESLVRENKKQLDDADAVYRKLYSCDVELKECRDIIVELNNKYTEVSNQNSKLRDSLQRNSIQLEIIEKLLGGKR